MLRQLRLNNVILVESAEINFSAGLNVLTGETGSGKSAVIEALSLVRGERANSELIRQGALQASVEALFEPEGNETFCALLEEAGISYEKGEPLIIRRELHASGKSRAFINHQMAQLALLQKICKQLIDNCGQHANQRLLSGEYHRQTLDIFAGLEPEVKAFTRAFEAEQLCRAKLEALRSQEAARLRMIEVCRMEIEELLEAALKENEEDELFAEYTLLANREEITSSVTTIQEALTAENHGVMAMLAKLHPTVDKLCNIDFSLKEMAASFKNARLELQEMSYTLDRYSNGLEFNPARLESVNERLTLLSRLKRKYGNSVLEMLHYLEQKKRELHSLENANEEIEQLQQHLSDAEKKVQHLAVALSEKRQKAAKPFAQALLKTLRRLNMAKADFEIKIELQKRAHHGDDKVEFYLAPNVGEGLNPLKNCASGGELSRVLLALKAMLAGKEGIATLIFDEIDANIGGETASVVGETLADIGGRHQLICITHFPQVARQAHHHIKIEKREKNGRTLTTITPLEQAAKQEELARMLGGEKYRAI